MSSEGVGVGGALERFTALLGEDVFLVNSRHHQAVKRVAPPLVAECFANLECKAVDTSLVNKYNLFVLEVLKAWTDPGQKHPKTIHHHGYGRFAVDGEMVTVKSRKP